MYVGGGGGIWVQQLQCRRDTGLTLRQLLLLQKCNSERQGEQVVLLATNFPAHEPYLQNISTIRSTPSRCCCLLGYYTLCQDKEVVSVWLCPPPKCLLALCSSRFGKQYLILIVFPCAHTFSLCKETERGPSSCGEMNV